VCIFIKYCYEVTDKLDRRLGSSEQDLYAGGETIWKVVELRRYRREVDSINNLHAQKIQVVILCSEFI
jgi:hypothetical protein